MLDPITPNPNPFLAHKPVQALLSHFETALPWLSDTYGLVQTGNVKVNKQNYQYPQVYRQDGSRETVDVLPNDTMKALCFFEYDGAASIEWTDTIARAGEIQHHLAAVVWLNLPLIEARGYDFSAELALDFMSAMLGSPMGRQLVPDAIQVQHERIFERYRFDPTKQQLLMYPFTGFRIPFMVRERFVHCKPTAPVENTGFNYSFAGPNGWFAFTS